MAAGAPAQRVGKHDWPVGLPLSVKYHADKKLYGCVVVDEQEVDAGLLKSVKAEWTRQARATQPYCVGARSAAHRHASHAQRGACGPARTQRRRRAPAACSPIAQRLARTLTRRGPCLRFTVERFAERLRAGACALRV
jgi:hypothetical protein